MEESTPKGSKVQRDQERLLEQALQRPGVATAAEAFSRVERYARVSTIAVTKASGYATGGNAG